MIISIEMPPRLASSGHSCPSIALRVLGAPPKVGSRLSLECRVECMASV